MAFKRAVFAALLSLASLESTVAGPVPASLTRRDDACSPCHQRQTLAQKYGVTDIQGSVSRNGIYVGMFPNDEETLCDLEGKVNAGFAFYGRYAQLKANQKWDASQIWSVMPDVEKTKAILQISLMPEPTWWGLKTGANDQAVAIAEQCAKIQKRINKPVWLRFAPDMNYYQTSDGEYKYGKKRDDFKTAWKELYKALADKAPDTKLIWSPTYSDNYSVFKHYWPSSDYTPHIVGMAYSPNQKVRPRDFEKQVEKFHDDYSSADRPFILTQASPICPLSERDRIDFLNTITDADVVEDLPHYIGFTYDNRVDGNQDRRIVILDKEDAHGTNKDKMNTLMRNWIRNKDPSSTSNSDRSSGTSWPSVR